MESEDFAAFILSHGRPDNVLTVNSLRRRGYTGRIFIVIDSEDNTKDKYIENYGESVIVFDKGPLEGTFDIGDNLGNQRGVIYARNANFRIAKDLGVKYFIQLDDDYSEYKYRYDNLNLYNPKAMYNLDDVFKLLVEFYKKIPALAISMSQGGDFIGGDQSTSAKVGNHLKRKVMNSFICSTDRPFAFVGRVNEDVTTYVSLQSRGGLFFQVMNPCLNQRTTQQASGGMTGLYLDNGTYVKSFYSVMYSPSSVKIRELQSGNNRLHHKVNWANAVPVILRQSVKKY